MESELGSHEYHRTWDLGPLPPGEKAIGCDWVYSRKGDGAYKARLVVLGNQQLLEEVGETYAPVAKLATLRVVFALAAAQRLVLRQFDVETAFLQSEQIARTVYMRQPPGFHRGNRGDVCHLRKAIYGLRQAPRDWHMTLRGKLLARGFIVSESDPSMFLLHGDAGLVIAVVYVDDGIVAARDDAEAERIMDVIASCFAIKRMGEPRSILGMTVTRDWAAGTITLSQEGGVDALVERFAEFLAPGAVNVPVQPGSAFQLCRDGPAMGTQQQVLYPSLVGSLQHFANCTRPDIAFAAGMLGRYAKQPRQQHWDAALRVLRYLRGSRARGITYGRVLGLRVYCDADHAGCVDTRRSTTGAVMVLHGGAIDWASTLQSTVAASTCEAEYQAAGVVVRMALWQRKLLADLGLDAQGTPAAAGEPLQPVVIDCDNQGAIALLYNPQSTRRSKHIDIVHHFARERVLRGEVAFRFCRSADNVADCFTKALWPKEFNKCVFGLGVVL
jgi:hypothetical protein